MSVDTKKFVKIIKKVVLKLSLLNFIDLKKPFSDMSQAPEDQPFVQLGPDHPTLYYPVSYKAQGGKGVIAIFKFL